MPSQTAESNLVDYMAKKKKKKLSHWSFKQVNLVLLPYNSSPWL